MASREFFEEVPPFPDDLPVASMSTISLASLTAGEDATAKSLIAACQQLGFFLLDLNGDTVGTEIIEDIDRLFSTTQDIMNLPEEVKERYLHDAPKSFLGQASFHC